MKSYIDIYVKMLKMDKQMNTLTSIGLTMLAVHQCKIHVDAEVLLLISRLVG